MIFIANTVKRLTPLTWIECNTQLYRVIWQKKIAQQHNNIIMCTSRLYKDDDAKMYKKTDIEDMRILLEKNKVDFH